MSPEQFQFLMSQIDKFFRQMAQWFVNFVSSLNSSIWWERTRYIRYFAYIMSGLFLIAYLYLIFSTNYLDSKTKSYRSEFKSWKSKRLKTYVQKWKEEVENKIKKDQPNQYKKGVLTAANILDETLDHLHFRKGSFEERVDQSLETEKFDWDKFREACKIEKELRQNFNTKLSYEEAQMAVESFQAVLENLNFF